MDLRTLKDSASEHFRKGRFAKAAEAYLELCRAEPKEAQYRIKLGDSYRRDGRRDLAVSAYREAARAYTDQGVVIKAIAACKLVLELEPGHREAQEALANLCTQRYVRPGSRAAPVETPRGNSPFAIELPEDSGSSGLELDTGYAPPPPAASPPPPPSRPLPPRAKDPAPSEVELEINAPPPVLRPSTRAAPPSPPAQPFDPSEGIELDLGDAEPAPRSAPAPIPAPKPKRRGASVDLSGYDDALDPPVEPSELEVLSSSDLEEVAPERGSAGPQRVSDLLSASLLIEHGEADGEEVELLSVTAAVPLGGASPSPISAESIRAASLAVASLGDAPAARGAPAPEPAQERYLEPPLLVSLPPDDALPDRDVPPAAAPAAEPGGGAAPLDEGDLGARTANEAFEVDFGGPAQRTGSGSLAIPSVDVEQRNVPLFSELPREAFLELLERLSFHRHGPGETIVREGDEGRSIFVLATGKAKVIKGQGTPAAVELATLEDGAFFGEMALLNGAPRIASIVAVEDCEVLELTEQVLQDLLARHPSVAASLKKFYRQRLLANVMAISPIFRSLGRADRRSLLERFKLREISAGNAIIREGEPTDGLYVVMHGLALVTRGMPDGSILPLSLLREGQVFGEMSVLLRQAASATVTARRRTLVLRLPKEDCQELISTHPTVLEVLSEIADARAREFGAIAGGLRPPPEDAVAALA